MALNTADQLRFFMNDRPRYMDETRYGDGTANQFQVSGVPLVSGATALGGFQPSAFVPLGGTAWSATGASFNYQHGVVSFSGVVSANSAWRVQYTYAVFSDQELDLVTGLYGDLNAMRLALVDNLMADAYKRARWGSFGGASYDDSKTLDNLMKMRSAIRAAMTEEQGPLGGIESWDANQQDY